MNAGILARLEDVVFPGGRAFLPIPARRVLQETLLDRPELAHVFERFPRDRTQPLSEIRPVDDPQWRNLNDMRRRAGAGHVADGTEAPNNLAIAWLLAGWGESVPRVQRMLLDALASGFDADRAVLTICVAPGLVGAGAVAVLELLEALARLARMCGQPPGGTTRLRVLSIERSDEAVELAREVVERWREPTRVRGGSTWARDSLEVRVELSWPEDIEADLLLVPLFDGQAVSEQETRSWYEHLAPSGLGVIGEPMLAARSDALHSPTPDVAPFVRPAEVDVAYFLSRFFGFDEFRDGQWPIIERILTGESVLGVLPTGAGKTVCFQLPALLQRGVALVVSPLVSLIDDQLINLRMRALDLAGGVNSAMTEQEKEEELELFRNGRRKFFYLSPERLQMASFRDELDRSRARGRVSVSMFVVDEAHIASEWGHDFRPSYLGLLDHAQRFAPSRPLVLLTATASVALRTDLLRMFELDADAEVRPPRFDRPELAFEVVRVGSEAERERKLTKLIREVLPRSFAGEDGVLGSVEAGWRQAGLISSQWQRRGGRNISLRAPELAILLKDRLREVPVDYYVSNDGSSLNDARKRYTQERFKDDRLPIVVATKGFGTGIDKPNVRWVIHTGGAGSIEGYYQEAGRAGRDRRDARGVLLLVPQVDECRRQPVGHMPACVGIWSCPYGLEDLCTFGIQATLLARSLPGVEADFVRFSEMIRTSLGQELIAWGGTRTLPTELAADTVDKRAFEEALNRLQGVGVLAEWRQHNNKLQIRIGSASPEALLSQLRQPLRGVRSQATLIESCLRQRGVSAADARDAAAVWGQYLSRRSDDEVFEQRYPQTKDDGDRTTEHVLYRLLRLDVVKSYVKSGRAWAVTVRPHDLERLSAALARFIARVVGEADVEAWLERFVPSNEPMEDTLRALHVVIEAHYQVYALRRWQQLANLEEFAQSTECRKLRLHNFLGAEPPNLPCGRCDICGIEPPEEAGQRRVRMNLARVDAAIHAANGRPSGDALQKLFTEAGGDGLPVLRDRALKRLEDDPNDLTALCIVVRALDGAEQRGRRDGFLDRIREVLLFRQDAQEADAVLRALPPRVTLELLEERPISALLEGPDRLLLEADIAMALDDIEGHSRAVAPLLSHIMRTGW